MASNFHVFCSDPLTIDLVVFNLWVKGIPKDQIVSLRVATYLQQRTTDPSNNGSSATYNRDALTQVVAQDTSDQIRMFVLLGHYFEQPRQLPLQSLVQLAPQVQQYMLQRFYGFDDEVFRELLGRKLTTKVRKDMDEVMDSTHQPLQSCIRQFDNLRVIFNACDDANFQGNIAKLICERFSLPVELSCRYAATVFLLYSKFNIQLSRKRIQYITQREFEFCAGLIMAHWLVRTQPTTLGATENRWVALYTSAVGGPSLTGSGTNLRVESFYPWTSNVGMDLDTSLTSKLRDVKLHLASGKRLEELLKSSSSKSPSHGSRLSLKLAKSTVKALLVIGSGLSQVKELRDLFEDVNEDVVEPLIEARVSVESVQQLFIDAASWTSNATVKHLLDSKWLRFLKVVQPMTVCMMVSHTRNSTQQ